MLNEVDVVIIGVNASATLKDCIESVLSTNYPLDLIHIYYVDGGSTDTSIEIAKGFPEVTIIELTDTHPTPGKGRNAGWQKGSSAFVQFLDSDTQLEQNWLEKAIQTMQQKEVVAVCGNRKEKNPDRTFYNWIADQEWNGPIGYIQAFGGDVMIRREALQKTRGYNDELVGGEDPELSLRLTESGSKIIHLDVAMTVHDIGMTSGKQYWRRAYRTGYAFAAVKALHSEKSNFWQAELKRIMIRGGGTLLLIMAAIFLSSWFLIPGIFLLFYPLLSLQKFKKQRKMTTEEAIKYALHCSIVVIPQCFGVLRYYGGVLFSSPLKNNALKIQTNSSEIE